MLIVGTLIVGTLIVGATQVATLLIVHICRKSVATRVAPTKAASTPAGSGPLRQHHHSHHSDAEAFTRSATVTPLLSLLDPERALAHTAIGCCGSDASRDAFDLVGMKGTASRLASLPQSNRSYKSRRQRLIVLAHSANITAVAAATLRLSTAPLPGIDTLKSQALASSASMPSPSAPST